MWPSWVAWLLCLCPTFPSIRLGHKGSTSAIVTAGSAGCVPQTGLSRKLAFLREYSVGEQKMFFVYYNINPQKSCILRHGSQSEDVYCRMLTQGKEPLTELFCLEDVSYLLQYKPPDVLYPASLFVVRISTLMHVYPGKGTLNGTILPGRCFLLSM